MKERSGLTPRGLEDAALLLSWRYWALGSLVGLQVQTHGRMARAKVASIRVVYESDPIVKAGVS